VAINEWNVYVLDGFPFLVYLIDYFRPSSTGLRITYLSGSGYREKSASIRNTMKNVLMELKDRILLRKRSVIETVNDELKNMCQIERSRHRAFPNFIAHTVAALIAYSFFPKKPSIKFQPVKSTQMVPF